LYYNFTTIILEIIYYNFDIVITVFVFFRFLCVNMFLLSKVLAMNNLHFNVISFVKNNFLFIFYIFSFLFLEILFLQNFLSLQYAHGIRPEYFGLAEIMEYNKLKKCYRLSVLCILQSVSQILAI